MIPINKCAMCNKKLGLIFVTCKCGKILCPAHKGLSEHSCDFDFKQEQFEKLSISLSVMKPQDSKLNKI